MAALKFASSHNMVAFLDKPTKSDGFEQIVDFLNAHSIKYALMVNPTIYTLYNKKVIVLETSVRSDLQLEDAEGTECLPNTTIFEQLTLMGAKTTAWNKFSSTMASAVICLATNQKFNFSKYIFDNMVKNLEGGVKFLMYPRQGKDFSGRDTPLFPTMIVQAQEQEGKGSIMPTVPQHTPTINPPSTSKPQKKYLSQRVIALETIKTNQALKIDSLKRRVKKLEKKKGSRTHRLRRLFKVGRSAQVVSSEDKGLGAQEDASKQGRKIVDLDADAEVTLVDEAQRRNDDNLMFDTGVLDEQEVEVEKVVSIAEVTTASSTTTTIDELTLAQTLIEIKATKPKAVTTAATTTTTAVTRPKARGVVVQVPKLMDKRKKHFSRLKAEEQRRKPPTKAQKRSQMSTYLKHMAGYKQNQLKNKNYNEIQKLFDKAMKRVNKFVDMDTELKQKLDESIEVELEDEAEMKKHMEIVFDDEVEIDAIPLATKPLIIID
ncbi:hypothetical protein Tco_1264728 [Tanacetum coccineum]